MLVRGDPGESAAEDLAASGIFAQRGDCVGAARGEVDALPDGDAAAHGGVADFAADAGVVEGGPRDAGRQGAAFEGLLHAGEVCGD